jgi:hypothetical protein
MSDLIEGCNGTIEKPFQTYENFSLYKFIDSIANYINTLLKDKSKTISPNRKFFFIWKSNLYFFTLTNKKPCWYYEKEFLDTYKQARLLPEFKLFEFTQYLDSRLEY